MRLLIDTHIALWSVDDNSRLGAPARHEMRCADTVFVSAASIWEIAIKFSLRRDRRDGMPYSGYDAIERFGESGFEIMAIEPLHAAAVGGLPMLHGDPFDRLIVAQAQVESMTLMTHDHVLAQYGDFVRVV